MTLALYKFLHVDNGDGQDDNATTPALTVDLIYQQTRFTESGISLSWSLFNKNYVADSPPGSSSVVYTSTCDVSNASVAANTTNTYAVLSPRDEYDDDYFNITAFDENREQIGTVDEPIRINSGGTYRSSYIIIIILYHLKFPYQNYILAHTIICS